MDIPEDALWTDSLEQDNSEALSVDRSMAIAKMAEIEDIYKGLPHLDCGSCGAPNCHALAEDIVRGVADESDCLIRLRRTLEKQNNN